MYSFVQYWKPGTNDMKMKSKYHYGLTLCLVLAAALPSGISFARDCACLQDRCTVALTQAVHPARCCCTSTPGQLDHKSKGQPNSDEKKPTGECPCCFSQIVNSSTVFQSASLVWHTNKAMKACPSPSRICYTSPWVLKILRPPCGS